MLLLLALALLGSAAAIPLSEATPRNTDLAAQYNLPRETIPLHYDVRVFLDPDNEDFFFGNVTIRIIPIVNDTKQVVLHAMEMEIDNVQIYNERDQEDLFVDFTQAEDDTHFLTINVSEILRPYEVYILHIDYVANYSTNMLGVYISTYEAAAGSTGKLIATQLQPTFARRAFPCYDEPALKAIFKTTLYAPEKYLVVRSNMPESEPNLTPDESGWVRHAFDETLVMSSYLLAYLVSDFEYIENDADRIYDVPFRVYSRPGTQDTAAFALDFGQKNMVALEEYIDIPYAFPKIDKAAIPDFTAGAMENWGLVLYREVALLVRDGVTSTSTKQNIGRIICHENTHMWFGNEVSPFSWTYTWLNEGFANLFENFGTDLVLPEWRMMDQFNLNMQNVFQADAVLSVNPMTHPVYTPAQILGTFNAVAYQKSGSVLRMVQHFLTPEVFRQGLTYYIRNMARQAAQPEDLYEYLQLALNNSNHSIPFNIITIMNQWANQGGFPVVTVTRSAPRAESLVFRQSRFLTDSSLSSTQLWHIPVNVALSPDPQFEDTKPDGWLRPVTIATSLDIPGLSSADWFIVNKKQTGYYRVNYDEENWAALIQVLSTNHTTIDLLNRAQLIDDAFNLARNGRVTYTVPLQMATYLAQEKDYVPWASAVAAFDYMDVVLGNSTIYPLFQRFIIELTHDIYEELTFTASPTEEHVTPYHRNLIMGINCRFGNENCTNDANSLLQEFQRTGELNPDIQTVVFCSSLRGGDAANFDYLWNMYIQTQDSSVRTILHNALGCTSNPEKRDFYLNQMIAEDSEVRDQDKHSIAVSVINSDLENLDVALDFLIENFHVIQPVVQGLSGTSNILTALSRRLTTEVHRQKIDLFYDRHSAIFTSSELALVGAIRENVDASIAWSENNLEIIGTWINAHLNNASSATASILIILATFIALLI